MDIQKILSSVDHTLLLQEATWQQIKQICDDGIAYKTASVCIPPSYVRQAKEYVGDRLRICTVIGFPNGYNTTAVKFFEAQEAIQNGADEIDMVINLGWLKDQTYEAVLKEIQAVRIACQDKILKVIIETCKLTREEKVKMCQIVSASGADYIKTSTGFGGGGATVEDIEIFSEFISSDVRIKAAGGISTLDDAKRFIELGADRLGTSRIVKIIKSENTEQGGY